MEFRRSDTGETASSLAALADARPLTFDVQALIPWVLADPPTHSGATPYERVRCSFVEPPQPREDEGEDAIATMRAARSPERAAPLLRAALENAVDRSLAGVRRVAVMTGGGLDSGALLALAVAWAQRTGGSAFGVALHYGAQGDDRPHLRALQEKLGCEIIRVAPEEAAGDFGLHQGVDAAPFTWPTAAMEVALMARAKAHGAERTLTGAGGDQLLDGVPQALAGLARKGDVRLAARRAKTLRGFRRPRFAFGAWVVRPLLASLVPRPVRRVLVRRPRVAAPSWAGPLVVDWLARQQEHRFAETYASAARAASLAEHESRVYRELLLTLRHQQSVASDVPRFDPYLDPLLVATVAALPPDWLLHGDVRRGLFREAMRGVLPESMRTREDKAAFEPAIEAFVGAANGFEQLRSWTTGSRLAALGIVDGARFRAAFERFAKGPRPDPYVWVTLWPALCVEAFLDQRASRVARMVGP